MSCRIRRGYQAVITAKGFGETKVFAESLEELDREVGALMARLEEARGRRGAAILARLAGSQRAQYKAAREALDHLPALGLEVPVREIEPPVVASRSAAISDPAGADVEPGDRIALDVQEPSEDSGC